MKQQNFKNHAQYVPMFHIVLFTIVLVINVLGIVNLVTTLQSGSNLVLAIMLEMIAVSTILFFIVCRIFPLKAQDRAIRAEENLRHFSLTGKMLDSRLTMSQIIALRFAPDNELIDLAAKAANENMGNKEIKQAIKNWRPDFHRV